MRRLLLFSVIALVLALALGGTSAFGRIALALGLPGVAERLFEPPAWRGVALYRAGGFDAAAKAFTAAKDPFNAGNAYAQAGHYAAALEAYDLAIAQGHPDAQANFDVVAAYYAGLGIDPDALALFPERKSGPQADSFVARGNARAAGSGSEVTNENTMLGLAELESRGRLGVRRIFDDKFMVADERWLQQLGDVPGEYLAARIALEYKRRVKAGLSPPEAEDPE